MSKKQAQTINDAKALWEYIEGLGDTADLKIIDHNHPFPWPFFGCHSK